MHRLRLFLAPALLLSLLSASSAQESKYSTPQPEHALLKRFVGEWQFEKQSAPADGQAPQKLGAGKIKAELLGEFFIVSRWSGNVYGEDFAAVQTLGYDVDKKAYSGTWIDSIMSHRWLSIGQLDAKSNELVIATRGPGPSGGTASFRERYRFNSADSITVVGEMQQGEEWVAFMTTQLTRKPEARPD